MQNRVTRPNILASQKTSIKNEDICISDKLRVSFHALIYWSTLLLSGKAPSFPCHHLPFSLDRF